MLKTDRRHGGELVQDWESELASSARMAARFGEWLEIEEGSRRIEQANAQELRGVGPKRVVCSVDNLGKNGVPWAARR